MTEPSSQRLAPQLAAYHGRRFPFRVWWVRDYAKATPGAWLRWIAKREVWNPTGGMPEYLYVRRGRPAPRRPERLAPISAGSHTVVPSRSKTRRPSWSHFASPASPWSARSIGPTTT